jgi:hypothetical protein
MWDFSGRAKNGSGSFSKGGGSGGRPRNYGGHGEVGVVVSGAVESE